MLVDGSIGSLGWAGARQIFFEGPSFAAVKRGTVCRWSGRRPEGLPPTFYLGRYPVTNAQYARYLKANPEALEPADWAERHFNQPRQPVVGVSWEDARAYRPLARLPSEAEWDYACRAGMPTRFHSGDGQADLKRVGWYATNSKGRPHPVGEKELNAFWLYDMHGNVWEWVEDGWHFNYKDAPDDERAWIGDPRPANSNLRGGCWHVDSNVCRSASHTNLSPDYRNNGVGFRLARSDPRGPRWYSSSG